MTDATLRGRDVFVASPERRLWALFDAGRQIGVAGEACELFQEALEKSGARREAGSTNRVGDALRWVGGTLEERRRESNYLPERLVSAVVLNVSGDEIRLHCIGDCCVHRAREGRGEVLLGPHLSSLLGWENPDVLRAEVPLRDGDIYSLVPSGIELTVEPGDVSIELDTCELLADTRVRIEGDALPSRRITVRVVVVLSCPAETGGGVVRVS